MCSYLKRSEKTMIDFRHKKTADKNSVELAFTQLFEVSDELLYKLQKIDQVLDDIYNRLLVMNFLGKESQK